MVHQKHWAAEIYGDRGAGDPVKSRGGRHSESEEAVLDRQQHCGISLGHKKFRCWQISEKLRPCHQGLPDRGGGEDAPRETGEAGTGSACDENQARGGGDTGRGQQGRPGGAERAERRDQVAVWGGAEGGCGRGLVTSQGDGCCDTVTLITSLTVFIYLCYNYIIQTCYFLVVGTLTFSVQISKYFHKVKETIKCFLFFWLSSNGLLLDLLYWTLNDIVH